nr:MAG TPA: hypothetical protein [Crassvirales sp.]
MYNLLELLLYYSCPGNSVNHYINLICINQWPLDTRFTIK